MPNRILREGILSSLRVNELDDRAENFYRRTHSVVDDYGRYHAHPNLLRAACYPLRIDTVTNEDVARWLYQCARAGLLDVYPAEGKAYLQLRDFRQQQRAKASKYPEPPANLNSVCYADAAQMLSACIAHAHLGVCVFEGEGEGGDGARGRVPEASPATHPAAKKASSKNGKTRHVIVDTYHATLPACREWKVTTPTRIRVLTRAEKLAREACKSMGIPYDPPEFWRGYFGWCDRDEWLAGRLRNPNNAAWRQTLETLVDDRRFALVMDKAMAELSQEGAGHE